MDGTLLPMDQDIFVKDYFTRLARHLAPHGYESHRFTEVMWKGVFAMANNDGSKTNEAAFWEAFSTVYGADKVATDLPLFEEFYETEFQRVQEVCSKDPRAAQIVRGLKQRGVRVALTTNPLFPSIATKSRIRWAGLSPTDFELITTYENCSSCKPNLHYYNDILHRLNLRAEDCIMVGNDVGDDMVARDLGMRVFLLTDCLINKDERDIRVYPHGDFTALAAYLDTLD